jgi:CHAD domain-containing protein
MSSGLADVHGVDATSSYDDRGVPDPASTVDPSPGVLAEAAGEPTIGEPTIDEPPIDEPPIDEPTLEGGFAAAAAPIASDAVQIEPTTADPFVIPTKTPGVLPEDTIAEAGRKVLRFHLARMIAREPATRLGEDEEELHAMRVATRRMRAAWRVFGDGFRPERTRRLRGRLRVVAGRLGAVRDRDVMIGALEAYQEALPLHERRAIQPLIDEWREQRDDARALLLRELDSDGYRRWVDDYKEFARHEGMATAPTLPTQPHRVRDTAASRIWLAYEHVRAFEPVLRWADVATLHDLRIAGKRLRYTLEFIRETLGPEATPLVARVVALQDHLGLLNDADVAATLARSFLVENAGELSETETHVIGRYLVSREQEVARLRRAVGGPWRGVAGLAFRRALGRVTAGL